MDTNKKERLTWAEIKEKYPHQRVGMVNIEYLNGNGGVIRSAEVVCTDKTMDADKVNLLALQGKIQICYTGPDDILNYTQTGIWDI